MLRRDYKNYIFIKIKYFKHKKTTIDASVTIGVDTKTWHFSYISEFTNLSENLII